ncbi:MAG: protein translocase subunit SecF, partial [bacterium]|nr:protein translocase subunit SecF [bacterium]
MKPLRLIPNKTAIPFIRYRRAAFALSAALIVASVIAVLTFGLNFGIDFRGGTLIEVRTQEPADISEMRSTLGKLGLGEISLQEFGSDRDVLIRIQRQDGDEAEQIKAQKTVRDALPASVEFRRTEFVGPTVGQELIEAGVLAVGLALLSILVYIWFRFEWQFGVGAIVALSHDIISTLGLFALIQHEFNLSTVAAVLTIAGYSINDTVVVYDRVRENLRRYKTMGFAELFELSINETLSRTTMTSLTTLLALFAIYFFGGAVLADFALAMIWGIVVGTYSSIFIAVPLLLYT